MTGGKDQRGWWVLKGLVMAWGVLTFVFALSGEGALAWSGLSDVVVRSEFCPAQPGDPRPIQYSVSLGGATSPWTASAWLLLLVAACSAQRFPRVARSALQLSLTGSAVALSLYGGGWLESVLLGQPYTELVSCDFLPEEIQAKTDQAHHFRAIWAFSVGCLMIPALRLLALESSTASPIKFDARRTALWRWAVAVFLVLIALLLVLPIPLGWPDMGQDQAFVVKELINLPLALLALISLGALLPLPRFRPAALDAVKAAAGLAFTNLTAIWFLRRSHEEWERGVEPFAYILASDLPPEALASLDAVESYYTYALFSIIVIWGASWGVGRLLLAGATPLDEPAQAEADTTAGGAG